MAYVKDAIISKTLNRKYFTVSMDGGLDKDYMPVFLLCTLHGSWINTLKKALGKSQHCCFSSGRGGSGAFIRPFSATNRCSKEQGAPGSVCKEGKSKHNLILVRSSRLLREVSYVIIEGQRSLQQQQRKLAIGEKFLNINT